MFELFRSVVPSDELTLVQKVRYLRIISIVTRLVQWENISDKFIR